MSYKDTIEFDQLNEFVLYMLSQSRYLQLEWLFLIEMQRTPKPGSFDTLVCEIKDI